MVNAFWILVRAELMEQAIPRNELCPLVVRQERLVDGQRLQIERQK